MSANLNSEISQPQRIHPNSLANLKPFKPGVSGNPGGFPQSVRVDIAYRKLAAMSEAEFKKYKPQTKAERIAYDTFCRAEKKSVQWGVIANKAAEIVADRVDGKPEQKKTVEVISTERLEISIVVQLRALARIDGREMTHDEALAELASTREKLEQAQVLGFIEAIEKEYAEG